MPGKSSNKYITGKNSWYIKSPWELCVFAAPRKSNAGQTKRPTTTSIGCISEMCMAPKTKVPTVTMQVDGGKFNFQYKTWMPAPGSGPNAINDLMDPGRNSLDEKKRLGN